MPASDFLGAVATGIEGYAGGVTDRETVRLKKAQAEDKMADIETKQELGVTREQYETLVAQQDRMQKTLARRNTFDSFDAYSADGDIRHLNESIRNDPTMRDLASNMASLAKIDTTNDTQLMTDAGLDPEIFTNPDTAEKAANRYIKMINTDGSSAILDMASAYVGTGYAKSLHKAKRAQLLEDSIIAKNLRVGEGKDPMMSKKAQALADAKNKLNPGSTTMEEELIKLGEKEIAGVTPGQHALAREDTKELEDLFGGREEFFKTNFNNPVNRDKAYPFIAEIEALEKVTFSTKEKNDINQINQLIALGDPSKELTEAQTGIIDNTFFNVKKYFTDENLGIGSTSAYAAFRNTVRHALFGSALTEHEIKSFNEAFGTLKQKLGPVLGQFKTGLAQVKAKLESIARFKNPHSAKFRLGVSQAKLDEMIGRIDERIRFLETGKEEKTKAPVAATVDPKTKAIMDGLLKKGVK